MPSVFHDAEIVLSLQVFDYGAKTYREDFALHLLRHGGVDEEVVDVTSEEKAL
jgi:hypothetical protein